MIFRSKDFKSSAYAVPPLGLLSMDTLAKLLQQHFKNIKVLFYSSTLPPHKHQLKTIKEL